MTGCSPGAALLFALVAVAVTSMLAQRQLLYMNSQLRHGADSIRQHRLELLADRFLAAEERAIASAGAAVGCSGPGCYSEHCTGGRCFFGRMKDGSCVLRPQPLPPWADPLSWSDSSRHRSRRRGRYRLQALSEFRCYVAAAEAKTEQPLYRSTLRVTDGDRRLILQSLHSALGRHAWRWLPEDAP